MTKQEYAGVILGKYGYKWDGENCTLSLKDPECCDVSLSADSSNQYVSFRVDNARFFFHEMLPMEDRRTRLGQLFDDVDELNALELPSQKENHLVKLVLDIHKETEDMER